jgi:hypothetical protein
MLAEVNSISNAMEEQSTGSRQILESISRLNEITQMVKGGSVEMPEGSKEVIAEGKNLEMATTVPVDFGPCGGWEGQSGCIKKYTPKHPCIIL